MVEVSVIKNEEGVFEEYISIDPLYEKITYLIADINNKLNEREKEKTSKNIFEAFEKEFSRSLSPMEYEIIMKWIEEGFREEIILEALKEAILNDVRSLRYIDRILIEWRNKKLDTIEKIREYSKNYKLRSDFEDTDNEEEIFHYNWLDNE
jgi:DNA replication protein